MPDQRVHRGFLRRFDPASAYILAGFGYQLLFLVGFVGLAALLTPNPIQHLLRNFREIFAFSALVMTALGLMHRQKFNAPSLTRFDEAAAFLALGATADLGLRLIPA